MNTAVLVIIIILAGVPAPPVYVPMASRERCQEVSKEVSVKAVKAKDGSPLIRIKTHCWKMKSA